jgi:hypothetical protein
VSVVPYECLRDLSGARQVSRVIDWLRENNVRFTLGTDGRPRTVDDFLREDLESNGKSKKAPPIRFP